MMSGRKMCYLGLSLGPLDDAKHYPLIPVLFSWPVSMLLTHISILSAYLYAEPRSALGKVKERAKQAGGPGDTFWAVFGPQDLSGN